MESVELQQLRMITKRPDISHIINYVEKLPKLDAEQVGSIRHIQNLADQLPNDWSKMMAFLPMQEDHGAYRYQIAYMFLALVLAHRHRLPGAPGLFKPTLDRLIEKMIHPEVWLYWRDTSRGKLYAVVDAPELPSEIDPIRRDNIMYSAYIQLMTLAYHALFDDDRYTATGSIKFKFEPLMCLSDHHVTYEYDEAKINNTVYWNMVQNGYLGVACEPYCVFQVCNQIPIISFRLYDWIYGGNIADEVIIGHQKAWEEFGGHLAEDGHFTTYVKTHTKTPVYGPVWWSWADTWCGMLMNSWNGDFVRANYENQKKSWLRKGHDGAMSVEVPELPNKQNVPMGNWGEFGWAAGCASELGDREVLDGLLTHADRYMNPKVDNGGYYYPRCDTSFDEDGNFTSVNPTVGNAMLPYARLNIEDGLRKFYENPWPKDHFRNPSVVKASKNCNFSRAIYIKNLDTLAISVSSNDKDCRDLSFTINNIDTVEKILLFDEECQVLEWDYICAMGSKSIRAEKCQNGIIIHLHVEKEIDLAVIF